MGLRYWLVTGSVPSHNQNQCLSILSIKEQEIELLSLKKAEINALMPSDAYMRRQPKTSLVQIMVCPLFGAMWIEAGILSIEPLGTNFSEILIEIKAFSFKKRHLKMSSAKSQPFCLCLGLNVFKECLDQSDDSVNQHINIISIANAVDWLMHLNCFMSLNSGMLFYFFKNRWPRADLARNLTTLAVHHRRIGEFKKTRQIWGIC